MLIESLGRDTLELVNTIADLAIDIVRKEFAEDDLKYIMAYGSVELKPEWLAAYLIKELTGISHDRIAVLLFQGSRRKASVAWWRVGSICNQNKELSDKLTLVLKKLKLAVIDISA